MVSKIPNVLDNARKNLNRNESDILDGLEKATLRRQMYERIAQGNQMSEIENVAQNKRHRS